MATLKFGVLDALMAEGTEYHDAMEAMRAKEKEARAKAKVQGQPGAAPARKRKRAGDTLKDREPW